MGLRYKGRNVAHMADRIAELEARLEISPEHDFDGIDTRDATIRELEKDNEALRYDSARYAATTAELATDVERLREASPQMAAVGIQEFGKQHKDGELSWATMLSRVYEAMAEQALKESE